MRLSRRFLFRICFHNKIKFFEQSVPYIHRVQRITNSERSFALLSVHQLLLLMAITRDIINRFRGFHLDLCIKFQLAKLSFISCSPSSYLASLFWFDSPNSPLRSSNAQLFFFVPKFRLQIIIQTVFVQ
jgi:hypothetical protein